LGAYDYRRGGDVGAILASRLDWQRGKAEGSKLMLPEAAREHGGREVVRVPFQLPAKAGQTYSGKGTEELGAVSLQLKR
jgi:hypothetical protein